MGNQSTKETVNVNNVNSKDTIKPVEKNGEPHFIVSSVQLAIIITAIVIAGLVVTIKKCKNLIRASLRKEARAELSDIIATDLGKVTGN